jgi:hypothetical protein
MKITLVQPNTGQAIWHHQRETMLAVGVWTERRPGHGEDAEPLWIHHVPANEGVIGVFDGSGGSGGWVAYEAPDRPARSSAWIGARLARASLESWFYGCIHDRVQAEPESLHKHLTLLLSSVRPAARSKVVGTIRHDLPTTMAAAHYQLGGDQVRCRALWAGDSRVYSLTPRDGLQALTRDHTVETDALEQLVNDPPLTNVVCADHPFTIDSNFLVLDLPRVLVSATDGFFGYIATPAHFECQLLGTLQKAADGADWAMRLAAQVSSYTGDDASLSVIALGYSGFGELRASFRRRTEAVLAHYWSGPGAKRDREALQQWRARTWNNYRPVYEQLMPSADRERT